VTTQNKAIVDKLLTNVSRKLIPDGYICEDFLPMIQVKQTSGKIGYYHKEHLRIELDIVGGNTPYPRITSNTRASDTYLITKHGLSDTISEEDYDNVELPFDGKEKSIADTVNSTTIITQNTTLSGTDQYSDYTNSDPIGDWRTARSTIKKNSGMPPNAAWMSWEVFEVLKFHTKLLELTKHTKTMDGGLGIGQLASAMGVKKLHIGIVPYNSAKQGQTDSLANVWGKHMGFYVAPSKVGKKQVTLGYRIQRKNPRRVFKNKLDNPPGSKEILADDSYQFLIVDTTAAYLIKDAIA
jgi:hypothetical protein